MKNIIIFFQFIVIAMGSNNDSIIDCNKYFFKFGNKESNIAFSGDAVYIEESQEAQINVKYTDLLFEDPIYFGLVQEDGKKPETICLKLKLLHITNTDHQSSQLISDLPIISSNNSINQQRQYSFKIPISQLDQKLLFNITNNVYFGSYSIIFESTNQEAFEYEFIFNFTITVNKDSQKLIDTTFKYKILDEQTNPNVPQSKLYWCTDFDCNSYFNESPKICLHDLFVIKQVIVDSDQSNQFLNNTEVWYTGNGLNKQSTPIEINNTTPGQVILSLEAPIVWRTINIKVSSALSETPSIKNIETSIQTRFNPLSMEQDKLRWCSDLTCSTFLEEIPNLHFNDIFALHIQLATQCEYFFTDIEVWFISDGLNKKVSPVQVINTNLNQVIIQLKAEVIWKSIKIQVSSNLKYLASVKFTSSKILKESDEITCIKPEGQEDCATYQCEICDNQGFIVFVHMILLIFFII